MLRKYNVTLKIFAKSIINMAIEGTKFEGIEPLIQSHNAFMFTSNVQMGQALKRLRKFPQLVVLGKNN